MDKKRKLMAGAVTVLAVLSVGTGVGIASSRDDDQPIAGLSRQRAIEAALEHVGQGTVIETEMGDDGAAYGVEIRLDDGSVVEVELDENFDVTGTAQDDDSDEVEGADDD
ncbi:MAG: PepSY domain-containing protein [Actinomycetota bacterium]